MAAGAKLAAVLTAVPRSSRLAELASTSRMLQCGQMAETTSRSREGEFHRSLQRSGHDGRVNPKQRPVEVPVCQADGSVRKSVRRFV